MDTIVDLAPGAEDNPLAVTLAERIRGNLAAKPDRVADFRALRGSVLVVAQDRGESLTMRFDHGRLTIHEGAVGIPAVTFCGDESALRRLVDLPLSRRLRLPIRGLLGGKAGGAADDEALRRTLALLANGDLKIYGLLSHARMVVRLLRVLTRG